MQSIMPAESAHLDHRLCVADPHEAEQGDHEDLWDYCKPLDMK